MAYAILRIEKLKSFGSITRSGKHTDRTQETPNANPTIKNIELVNSNNLTVQELVKEKIGDIKHRKDAVLCAELLLTASPEYFRPDAPNQAGYYQPERLQEWFQTNLNWLKEKFGNNLIKATVHLDEVTPHIAAYIVPIHTDPKTGQDKLSYNVDFGGSKHRLEEWQDDYAEAMACLSLRRGDRRSKGSKAEHQDVKTYYTNVNASLEEQRQEWGNEIAILAADFWMQTGKNSETKDKDYLVQYADGKLTVDATDGRGTLLSRQGDQLVTGSAITKADEDKWRKIRLQQLAHQKEQQQRQLLAKGAAQVEKRNSR